MAFITKDNINRIKINTKRAYWFIIIPYDPKLNSGKYKITGSGDGYSVYILTPDQFKDLYYGININQKDLDLYIITKDLHIDEVSSIINESILYSIKSKNSSKILKYIELIDVKKYL